MALDVQNNFIYWTEVSNNVRRGRIMRASLDGRNPRQIRQGLDKPRAIVLYKPTRFVSRDYYSLLLAERPGALANQSEM